MIRLTKVCKTPSKTKLKSELQINNQNKYAFLFYYLMRSKKLEKFATCSVGYYERV